MKHLCLFSLLFKVIFALSVGFNYQYNVPKEAFYTYDWLVINPNVKTYKTSSKLIAYISIGEQEKKLPFKKIGYNHQWKSYIYDIRDKNYQKYLLNKLKKAKKFNGFFFDTLDSYEMTKVDKNSYIQALINFFKEVKKRYPNKIIIFNRGFELIKYVKPTAIVIEDYFTLNGKPIPKSDRMWLKNKLNNAKSKGILPIVIEYVDPFDKKKAIKIAKKIKQEGFIPYVADKNLYYLGVSETYLKNRRILVIYSDVDETHKSDSLAHVMISMPLEFFGYIPTLVNINHLPQDTSMYDYIIITLDREVKNKNQYIKWLKKQLKEHKKILFLSTFGINNLNFLNIDTTNSKDSNFKLYQTKLKPFEAKFDIGDLKDYSILKPKNAIPLLSFKNNQNQITITAAKTKWGGYFLNPFIDYTPTSFGEVGNIVLWKIDPFYFIPYILDFKPTPFPDFTTENGRRIAFSHIDGDGFVNKNDMTHEIAAKVLYREVFTKYNIPFSESVIEGEIAPYGIYPKYSKIAIKTAKKIFKLKNIEPASHGFSHPFDWQDPKHPRLPIKHYKFSYKREIAGSLKFVSKLAGKKAKLFFWTGACNPSKEQLAFAYKQGFLSINGQDTCITNDKKFLFYITPLGIQKGDYFQVYGQITNENIFTDLWKNKIGYIKAIQTMKLTDNPRRLKAIDIYFHNYSGAYKASLYALKKVIEYTLKQNPVFMFTSNWLKIALDFENSVLLKDLDGNYIFKNSGNLRTLKIKGKHPINMKKSKGVLGYVYQKGYTYISLDNSKIHKIVFGKSNKPYLIYANKRLIYHKKNIYKFNPRWGKLTVKFFMPKNCSYKQVNSTIKVMCETKK